MSHSQTIKVLVNNKEALELTAKEMNAKSFSTEETEVKMYDGTYRGMFVHFKNWNYPVVIANGDLRYDSYNGAWGNERDLKQFRQAYAANVVIVEGQREGMTLQSDSGYKEGSGNRVLDMLHSDGSIIRTTVGEEGNAVLEVVGCAGSSCQAISAGISRALGQTTSEELKPEFHEQEKLREKEAE